MIKCLCCNKAITEPDDYEKEVFWHKKCIRSFFGTRQMPAINCSEAELEKLANQTVNKGLTVPGVQKKLSLHLDTTDKNARLTIVDYPAGYILKPQSPDYEALPEAEYLSMEMAKSAMIKTVPHALMLMGGKYAYITRRIDRRDNAILAMEDFCQLSGRMTADKYRSSYENCGKVVKKYSQNIGLDLTELFYRLLFCLITGNSDMHLKNFSLIETEPGSRVYVMSDAYDMLPVNIIVPVDKEQMALTMNGKKSNIRKKDFLILAEHFGIPEKSALGMIRRMTGYIPRFEQEIASAYIPERMKEELKLLIAERTRVFLTE